jgi:hypothetical protein
MRVAAGAVRGGELARALNGVAQRVDRESGAFADRCAQWSFDLDESVAAYEAADRHSEAALRSTSWRAQ